jgi:hypothetical protein
MKLAISRERLREKIASSPAIEVEAGAREIFSVVFGTEYAGMFHPAYEGNEQFWRIVAEASCVAELVEVLEFYVFCVDNGWSTSDAYLMARKALARYRGEA